MRSYLKLVVAQVKLFVREPLALFFTIAFPTLFLLLTGAAFGLGNEPFAGSQFGVYRLPSACALRHDFGHACAQHTAFHDRQQP